MANNRMWLVNQETGKKALIAKYYPSTGWSLYDDDFLGLSSLFDAVYDETVGNQDTRQWRLEFEDPSEE